MLITVQVPCRDKHMVGYLWQGSTKAIVTTASPWHNLGTCNLRKRRFEGEMSHSSLESTMMEIRGSKWQIGGGGMVLFPSTTSLHKYTKRFYNLMAMQANSYHPYNKTLIVLQISKGKV